LKKAFTLIELLTVIAIIGLVATAALVVLKDNAEIKAKQYTKRVMQSFKSGIIEVEQGRYVTGFVNDFGTIPPYGSFLLNRPENGYFIDDSEDAVLEKKLQKYRFLSVVEQNSTKFAAPFMSECTEDGCKDPKVNQSLQLSPIDSGFLGGYLKDDFVSEKSISLRDGWGNELVYENQINQDDSFVTIISYGSDGIDNIAVSLLKDEFNEFSSSDSLKGFYADDIISSYQKRAFKPRNITFDIALDGQSKVLIYSPMLYYVEGSSGSAFCKEKDATQAECDGEDRVYKPYIEGAKKHNNLWWHIGLIKYEFGVKDNGVEYLHINNDTTDRKDDFFNAKFLISAGLKEVAIVDENNTIRSRFSEIFFPDQTVIIRYPR